MIDPRLRRSKFSHRLYHHDWENTFSNVDAMHDPVRRVYAALPRLQAVAFRPDELGFASIEAVEEALKIASEGARVTNRIDRENGLVLQLPFVEDHAFVDGMADLFGGVYISTGCFVGPAASIRLDEKTSLEPLVIGRDTNLQDHVIVHAHPGGIGSRVIIAHDAVVHGCVLEDDVTVYIKAIVDTGAYISQGVFIDAGAYVGRNVRVPPNRYVAPMRTVLSSDEAAGLPEVNEEHRAMQKLVLRMNVEHTRRYLREQYERVNDAMRVAELPKP